jgi:stress response protein SCP2
MKIAHNTYYLPAVTGDQFPSLPIANAFAMELLPYGITVSHQLFMRVASSPTDVALEFCRGLLAEYTVGKLNPPLFPNWERRTSFTFDEIVVQILGYVFQVSGNDLADPGYMTRLLAKVNIKEQQCLLLGTEEEAQEVFLKLVNSSVSQDRENQKNLFAASKVFGAVIDSLPRIKSDEARVAVLLAIHNSYGLYESLKKLKCSAADVLRFATVKNGDIKHVKLPSDVVYQSLTWKERTSILRFLNEFSFENLSEALGKNRTPWDRFFKHVHLFNQKDFLKYTTINVAARVSLASTLESVPARFKAFISDLLEDRAIEVLDTGNLAYRTFASRVDTAISTQDVDAIIKLFSNNSGYLLRNIGHISNGVKKADERKFIAFVREHLPTAGVDVLFAILSINIDSKFRVIDVKGDTVIQPASYNPLIREIQGDIKRDLWARFGLLGQVKVDDELRDKIVPFLSKNADLQRGTRIKFDEKQYIYLLAHWIQPKNARTDIDTSYIAFDANWKPEIVYFGNQANSYITHGGDITNAPAPHGATEYGKISLTKIPTKIKYIVPIINVFCGVPFSENEEAYAGFMFSDNPTFNINGEHVRYDLSQPANSNIPFIIDVEDQSILILDYNSRVRLGATAHSEIENMKNLISASETRSYVTMGMLADILSGDAEETDLTITKYARVGEKEIQPDALYSIFSKG